MTTLAQMSVEEASDKAMELFARGWYLSGQENGYVESDLTFDQYIENEFDSDFSYLWTEVKYEGDRVEFEGWTVDRVAEYGGEGKGEQFWVVVSVSDGQVTRYFRKDGWYASYDGGHLDGDVYEVHPEVRQVTVYE